METTNLSTVCVFLRGVMPVGKNKVPMAQLREVLSEAGYQNVRTWIQSGNVVLNTWQPLKKVELNVHNLIKGKIGADLVVVARYNHQLQQVLDDNPFVNGYNRSRIFYTLLAEQPPVEKVEALMDVDFNDEKLFIKKDTAYMYIPGNAARSKLSNNMLEKRLDVGATTRNFNTLNKMVQLSREDS